MGEGVLHGCILFYNGVMDGKSHIQRIFGPPCNEVAPDAVGAGMAPTAGRASERLGVQGAAGGCGFSEGGPDGEEELWRSALPCLLDIGAAMLVSGADVRHVERMLDRMGYAYGAVRMDVFVITAHMVVTITLPSGREHTLSRRIDSIAATDFSRLQALDRLCAQCCVQPLPADELRSRLQAIADCGQGAGRLFIGGTLAVAAFAVFFGGSWVDALVAALVGAFVCYTMRCWRPFFPNYLIYNFTAALASGILIGVAGLLVPQLQSSVIIIGVIMILIPGIPMTNAIRDLIAGDTLTGIMRLVESLLWALALALGFMAAMVLTGWVG